MDLTAANVQAELTRYLDVLLNWSVPELPRDPIGFFLSLKRERVKGGPYDGVAIFELANRAMSDLVVLFSARTLLFEGLPRSRERVVGVRAALGTQQGHDLVVVLESGERIVGECFNVAPSFFTSKHRTTLKALQRLPGRKIIAFNRDAVSDVNVYVGPREDQLSYVLVDVAAELEGRYAPRELRST